MLKGLRQCVRRYPKPRFITFICLVTLVSVQYRSIQTYFEGRLMQVFNHTGSASQQSIEAVLCPMPRVFVGRILHKGKYIPAFLNYAFYWSHILPYLNPPSKKHRHKNRLRHAALNLTQCLLERKRSMRYTDSFSEYTKGALLAGKCLPPGFKLFSLFKYFTELKYNVFDDQMMQFLHDYYETLDEKLLVEYERLLDMAWILPYENITLSDWLDHVGVDLLRHLDGDKLQDSFEDMSSPLQTIKHSVLTTRIAPQCLREVLTRSKIPGHQPSKLVFPFRNGCLRQTKFQMEAWPNGSMCLGPSDIYVSLYITPVNSFTDMSLIAEYAPFRVPVDRQTRIHIALEQRSLGTKCIQNGEGQSQTLCLENCIFKKALRKMHCMVPWLGRMRNRKEFTSRVKKLPACTTKKDIEKTVKTLSFYLDDQSDTSCQKECDRDCRNLKVHARITGSIKLDSDDLDDFNSAHLELVFVDKMPVFSEEALHSFGQLLAEIMGNMSFFIGVALVALYDWLIGVCLWMMGKLPFIPPLPPVIKSEIYTEELSCSCARVDPEAEKMRRKSIRRQHEQDGTDDSSNFLLKAYKHPHERRKSSSIPELLPSFDSNPTRKRSLAKRREAVMGVNSGDIAAMLKKMAETTSSESQSVSAQGLPVTASGTPETTKTVSAIKGNGLKDAAKSTTSRLEGQVRKRVRLNQEEMAPSEASSSHSNIEGEDDTQNSDSSSLPPLPGESPKHRERGRRLAQNDDTIRDDLQRVVSALGSQPEEKTQVETERPRYKSLRRPTGAPQRKSRSVSSDS